MSIFLPPRVQHTFKPAGLGRPRVHRYDVGQKFGYALYRGEHDRGKKRRCFWTPSVYLNDGVCDDDEISQGGGLLQIRPEQRIGLIFSTGIGSYVGAVTIGHKYIMWAEVMFERVPSNS